MADDHYTDKPRERRDFINGLTPGHLALMKDVAEAAATAAISRALTAVGIDTNYPLESQRVFATLRRIAERLDNEDATADADWLRRTRKRTEGVFGKAIFTAVAVSVASGLYAMMQGIAYLVAGSSLPPRY